MTTYHLFISHSWAHSNAYDSLTTLLDKDPDFSYKDYSVPKDDPIHTSGSDSELRDAITQQMGRCSVILIMAGVYASYSKWIDREIKIAQYGFQNRKPMVAIEPWGSEKTSEVVKNAADKIVKWNTDSIVTAIRELA